MGWYPVAVVILQVVYSGLQTGKTNDSHDATS
jgi:hypothetical protein